MGLIHEDKAYGLTIRESATDGSDFTNPDADYRRLFLGEDGSLHLKDSAGTVTDIAASSSVATDAIFDAKGDLAVGTGSNTSAKLTVGANDTIIMADSGQSTGLKYVASQTPSTQDYSDAAAEGTADTYARGDHKHGMPASGGASTNILIDIATPIKLTGGNITANQTSWGELAAETGGPGTGGLDMVLSGVAAGDIVEVSLGAYLNSAATYVYLDIATIVSAAAVNYFGAVTGASTGDGCVCWAAITSREETVGGTVAYALVSGDISSSTVTLRPWMRTSAATNRTIFGVAADPMFLSAKVFRP